MIQIPPGLRDQRPLLDALANALARMPDPFGAPWAEQFEQHLSAYIADANAADAAHVHAVAVASGTAALHTALACAGIGPNDEVLLPSLTVVMSAAPILATGARPVFVDSDPHTLDIDYHDAARRLTERTRAIMPVHLWGRMGDPAALRRFADQHALTIIEDACQAVGSSRDGQPAGTIGDYGAFSTKDGKILWSGEGGFLLTRDNQRAALARAYRTHWQTPPAGQAPLSRPAANYRLAEPLAAIAALNTIHLPYLLTRRYAQTRRLLDRLAGLPGLTEMQPHPAETWNHYAPLLRIDLPEPRRLCECLTALHVPNSVGTFKLVPCDTRPAFAAPGADPCPGAARVIDTILAPVLTDRDDENSIDAYALVIEKEVSTWTR